MNTVLRAAVGWLAEGREVALATVVSTWGSAPRRPGALMCIAADGAFVGSVSGGCVETAIVDEAAAVIRTGHPALLSYGVSNADAWEVGLACGGTVEVRVERVEDATLLRHLLDAVDQGETRIVATDLKTGVRWVLDPADPSEQISGDSPDGLLVAARSVTASERSGAVQLDDSRILMQLFAPPVRVIVVGAVHIGQHLVELVRTTGYGVVVVDPRTAFAAPDRFPDVDLIEAWPAQAFEKIGLDRRTAVVTVTHDPKLDDPALEAALRSDAFYIGALGSRKTHAARVERLREAGFDTDAIDRIHAPVGLDIGARTPGEIAASILAEIVQELRADRS